MPALGVLGRGQEVQGYMAALPPESKDVRPPTLLSEGVIQSTLSKSNSLGPSRPSQDPPPAPFTGGPRRLLGPWGALEITLNKDFG